MSLLDAFLLEPVRINLWFAERADGIKGSGTQSDPYNSLVFDEIMAGLPASPPIRVHLGPGEFATAGYYDGMSGGWQPHPGMKIMGSGMDVTTLKVTGAQDPGSGTRHYFAIGHALGSGGTLMDHFEVSDLTIDCDLASQGTSAIAIGGVRVLGNHVRIRRIKVKNWGTRSSSLTCMVLAAITGDPSMSSLETRGMSIEECIVVDPYVDLAPLPTNPGKVDVLYVGLKEAAGANPEGEAIAPVIRNCYVDCGKFASLNPPKNPLDYEIRALAMSACRGGVVEGNEIHNARTGGPYCEMATIASMVVRDNSYHNVRQGPCVKVGQKSGTTVAVTGLSFVSSGLGYISTATTAANHNLKVGDRVELNFSVTTSLNGLFVVTEIVSATQFKYFTPGPDDSPASGTNTMEKVFGTGKLVLEGNTIELAANDEGGTAVEIDDDSLSSQDPDHVHGDVVVRANRIAYVDEVHDSGFIGTGVRIRGAKQASVQDNWLDTEPSNPLQDLRSGHVTYVNNRRMDGTLIRGFKDDTNQYYDELETDAEDALVLALFNKR